MGETETNHNRMKLPTRFQSSTCDTFLYVHVRGEAISTHCQTGQSKQHNGLPREAKKDDRIPDSQMDEVGEKRHGCHSLSDHLISAGSINQILAGLVVG